MNNAVTMRRYEVAIPQSVENTRWNVDATSPTLAADLYVRAAMEENISVDMEELCETGRLAVMETPAIATTGRVIGWEECADLEIPLEELPSWRDALSRGYDPLDGSWVCEP